MEKNVRRAVLLLQLLSVILLVTRIFAAGVLDDEVAVITTLKERGFEGVLYALPSLPFYMFSALYPLFGSSVIPYRLLNIIPFVLLIYVCSKLARRYLDGQASVVFWFLFALSPLQLLWYPFARNYCIIALFVVSGIYFSLKLRDSFKMKDCLVLCLLLAGSTYFHYLSFVAWAAPVIVAVSSLRKNRKVAVALVLVLCVSTVLTLPNLLKVMAKAGNVGGSLSLKDFAFNFSLIPFISLAGETIFPWRWIVTGTIALFTLFMLVKAAPKLSMDEIILFLVFIVVSLSIAFLDLKHTGLMRGRYLTLTSPVCFLVLALFLQKLNKPIRMLSIAYLAALFFVSDYNLFAGRDYWKAGLLDRWHVVIGDITTGPDGKKPLVISSVATFDYYALDNSDFNLERTYKRDWSDQDYIEKLASQAKEYGVIYYIRLLTAPYINLEEPFIGKLKAEIAGSHHFSGARRYFRQEAREEIRKYTGKDYPEYRAELIRFDSND